MLIVSIHNNIQQLNYRNRSFGGQKMWTAIYMVEGAEAAKKLQEKLKAEGFLVKVKPFSKEGDNIVYKILVPEFEADDAQTVLIDLGLGY